MRKRLRELHVAGRSFVWKAEILHVPAEGDCHRCIRVRVWGSGKNSQALQADLLSTSWDSHWGACATDGTYPSSGDVRALIVYAVAHGWEPDRVGGTFLLSERDHAFELANFLITDRLHDPTAPDPTARVQRRFVARMRLRVDAECVYADDQYWGRREMPRDQVVRIVVGGSVWRVEARDGSILRLVTPQESAPAGKETDADRSIHEAGSLPASGDPFNGCNRGKDQQDPHEA